MTRLNCLNGRLLRSIRGGVIACLALAATSSRASTAEVYPSVVIAGSSREALRPLITRKMADRKYEVREGRDGVMAFECVDKYGQGFGELPLLGRDKARRLVLFNMRDGSGGITLEAQFVAIDNASGQSKVRPVDDVMEDLEASVGYKMISYFLKDIKVEAETGCPPMIRYEIEHTDDKFDGFTMDRMKHNFLYSYSGARISLNAQRYKSKEGKVTYSIIAEYIDEAWLFIEAGETLVLLVDGERVGLKGDGSLKHRDVVSGKTIKEQAWYEIPSSLLARIAAAKVVEMKLSGSTKFVVRTLDACTQKNLGKFLAEVGAGDPPPPAVKPAKPRKSK